MLNFILSHIKDGFNACPVKYRMKYINAQISLSADYTLRIEEALKVLGSRVGGVELGKWGRKQQYLRLFVSRL